MNFQLQFEVSKEVLLYFCNKYELDQTRTHLLLSELESIQKKTKLTLSPQEKKDISKFNKDKRLIKFGSGILLIIGLSIKYIDGDLTLSSLLSLNKDTHMRLSKTIYK